VRHANADADAPPPAVAATSGKGTGFSTEGLEAMDPVQSVQLIALLEAASVPHGLLLGKAWPRRKHTYLVAALDAERSDEGQRFHIIAFDLSGPSVRLVASGGPFWLSKHETLEHFDLAAFRLTSQAFAFGLRYARERSYAGGGIAKLEGLFFFRIDGEEVEQILRTSISYEADLAGEWNEDGTRGRDYHVGRAVIIVQQHKTDGYFDWLKRAEDGRAAPIVWSGDRYWMNGADPLETEQLDIFDVE
jgi:hypothetical protein